MGVEGWLGVFFYLLAMFRLRAEADVRVVKDDRVDEEQEAGETSDSKRPGPHSAGSIAHFDSVCFWEWTED